LRGRDQEDHGSRPAQAKARSYLKKSDTHTKRVGRVYQMVEHLPSKCEALNSNPSTTNTKKNMVK
jgi:hypothetical protein